MNDNDEYFLWNGEEVSGPHARDVVTDWLAANSNSPEIKVALVGSEDWKAPSEIFPVPPPIPKTGPPPLPRQNSSEVSSVTIEVDAHADLWAEAVDAELKRAGLNASVELVDSKAHGKPPAIGGNDQLPVEVDLGSNIEPYDSGGFIGDAARSASGRYTLAWNSEEYRFLDGDKVITNGRGHGFGLGKVTEQGVALLTEISYKGRGILFALKSTGEEFFKKSFACPVDGLDVTPCGNSAVCVGFDRGATRLMLLDLQKGAIRSLTELVYDGTVGSVQYVSEKKAIAIHYEQRGPVHHYAMDGTFLDSEGWTRERTLHMNGYELLAEAETRMSEHGDGPYNDEVLDLLKRALQQKVSPLTRAKIHRRLGEVIARTGDHEKAVAHLESALKLDPKIGVKRLLNKLRSSEPS